METGHNMPMTLEARGSTTTVELSRGASIAAAADGVVHAERAKVAPSLGESVKRIIGKYATKGMLTLTALMLIAQAGCGNTNAPTNQEISDAFHNVPPPAAEVVKPGQVQAPGSPEVVQVPFVERGQLKELPKDVLPADYLKQIGITLTNTGATQLHLRNRVLQEIPLVKMVAEAHVPGKAADSSPVLDIIALDSGSLNDQSIKAIPDATARQRVLTRYEEDKRQGKPVADGMSFYTQDFGTNARHYYTVVAIGGSILDQQRDDLPNAPKSTGGQLPQNDYTVRTFSTAGEKLTQLLGHETIGHFPGDKLPGMDTNETNADQRGLQTAQAREKDYKEGKDASLFVITQKDQIIRVQNQTVLTAPQQQAA